MNSATKRFERILRKEYDKTQTKLRKLWVQLYKKDSFLAETKKIVDEGITDIQSALDEYTYKERAMRLAKFKESNHEIIDYHDTIGKILTDMTEKKYFWDYAKLTICLNWFDFSRVEALEIYAYFLNITITGVLNFNTNENEDVYNKSKQEVEEANKVPKIFRKIATKLIYNDQLKHARNDQVDVKHLRNVISPEGDILPFEYATDLIWIFKKHNFKLDINIIRQVLEESENRFKKQKAEEEASIQAEAKKKLASKELEEKMNKQAENIALDFKERRNAVQELKNI